MKNKVLKRMLPASLAAVMIMSLGACGQKKAGGKAGDGCDDRSDHVGRRLHRYRGRS